MRARPIAVAEGWVEEAVVGKYPCLFTSKMCIYADPPSSCDDQCGHMSYSLTLPAIFQMFRVLPPLPHEGAVNPVQLMYSLEEQTASFSRILEQSTAVYEVVTRLEQNISQIEGFLQHKTDDSTDSQSRDEEA
jgi:hypothetical protein